MIEYEKKLIPLAKELRKNMTPWERKLWYNYLRSYPVKFRRQQVIHNYIVDFYCAKARLIVELDGSGHYSPSKIEYDLKRTECFEQMGFTVIRISNNDISDNFRGVCDYIDCAVNTILFSGD